MIAAGLWLALAGAAAAQQGPRAEGDRLLAATGAADLFVNESEAGPGAILLRHKASGFRCVLNPGEPLNAVRINPGSPRGDDVACTSRTITDVRTMYYTRSRLTADQEVDLAALAITARYPEIREVDVTDRQSMFALPTDKPLPTPLTRGFGSRDGYEQVTVGVVDGWAVKFRFSTPPNSSRLAGILESFWVTTVLEAAMHRERTAP